MPWPDLALLRSTSEGRLRPSDGAAPPMSSSQKALSAKAAPRIRPVPAVTRAVAILRLLGRRREPMNAKSIADELDLVPSTCLHILRALTAERLLSFDSNSKRYKLGVGMLALARGVLETDSFAQTAQPMLDAVAKKWGVTAIGVEVVDLDHIVVTALANSQLPFRLHVDIGSRFPALISASGRLVAAFNGHSQSDLKTKFNTLRWQAPIRFEDWLKEVHLVKEVGHSADYGTYIRGILIIAVPVFDVYQHATHTIVTASILDQLTPEDTDALIIELKDYADQISQQLYSLE